ncbi:MAG: hypothetical protein L0G22_07525 [Propionibacteriaceae bacterium]|nr:hypothetical protein [Propionibacteriaceae bacterium]
MAADVTEIQHGILYETIHKRFGAISCWIPVDLEATVAISPTTDRITATRRAQELSAASTMPLTNKLTSNAHVVTAGGQER